MVDGRRRGRHLQLCAEHELLWRRGPIGRRDLVHDRDAAWALLTEYTKSEALRRHALAVEAAVRYYARLGGEDEDIDTRPSAVFGYVIAQIAIIDIVFSLDSVFTAVGLAPERLRYVMLKSRIHWRAGLRCKTATLPYGTPWLLPNT